MAFEDWEFFKSGASIFHYLDQTTVLLSGGSLHVLSEGAGDRVINCKVTDASGINHGYVHGKLRSIIRVDSVIDGFFFGFACLQSQDNITTSGDFYFCVVRTSLSSYFSIQLYKVTGGLSSGSFSLLDETSNHQSSEGIPFALEVEWSASSGTQVDFVIRIDNNALDFSSLVDVISVSDLSSPFISSLGEGFAGKLSSSEQIECFVDKTQLYRILP
jgi:hypothetical protein